MDGADNYIVIEEVDPVDPGDVPIDPDTTPPELQSTDPVDEATDVEVNAPIILTFDDDVQAGTGFIRVFTAADNTLFEEVSAEDATYADNTVTVDFDTDLALSTDYYVQVEPGAIQNVAGLDYAGFEDAETLNFTTSADAPPVHEFDDTIPAETLVTQEAGGGDFLFTYALAGNQKFSVINEFSAGDAVQFQAGNELSIINPNDGNLEMIFGEIGGADGSWFVTFTGLDAGLVADVEAAGTFDDQVDVLGAAWDLDANDWYQMA